MITEPAPDGIRLFSARPADRGVFLAAAVLVTAMLISRATYVPMWDGRMYADCIVDAASRTFSIGALRCTGHPSYAYIALVTLVQRAAPGSYPLLLVTNALLFLAACVGFHRLLTHAFPAPEHRLDRALLVACFAVQPSFLASIVQPGLDLALLPGFLWCTVFALERRWASLIAIGTALVFTKETGLLLYAALLACYLAVFVLFAHGSARSRISALLRLTPLAAPGLAFALYLLYGWMLGNQSSVWNDYSLGSLLYELVMPWMRMQQLNYLAIVFVLTFAWVASGWIAWDLLVGSVRLARRLPPRPVSGADPRVLGFLTLLTAVTVIVLTRYATFGNPRYLLTGIGLLPIPFYASLLRSGLRPTARRSIVATFGVALLVSNVRTLDPLSRRLYGTFPVGNHELLEMTSLTGECCVRGRDQLVYNLEFTVLDDLQQQAFAAVAANDSTVLVLPNGTWWYNVGAVDKRTHRRVLRRGETLQPTILEVHEVLDNVFRPRVAWFVALPNGRLQGVLRDLAGWYDVGQERRFWRGGYSLSVYPLTLRDAAADGTGMVGR